MIVRHLRRSAIYRGGGSIGIIGIARSGLLLAKDPDDDNARVLALSKSNLGPPSPSLRWRFADCTAPRIEWLGESEHTADGLANATIENDEERSTLDDAATFLRQALAGGSVPSVQIMREARQAGIAEKTLRRAGKAIGAMPRKRSFSGKWDWEFSNLVTPEGWPPSNRGGPENTANPVQEKELGRSAEDDQPQDGQGEMATLDDDDSDDILQVASRGS